MNAIQRAVLDDIEARYHKGVVKVHEDGTNVIARPPQKPGCTSPEYRIDQQGKVHARTILPG